MSQRTSHPCAYSFGRRETLMWVVLRRSEDPPRCGHRTLDDNYDQSSARINLWLRLRMRGITCLGEIGVVGEGRAWNRRSR